MLTGQYSAYYEIPNTDGIILDVEQGNIVIPIDSPLLNKGAKRISAAIGYAIDQYELCCDALEIEYFYLSTNDKYEYLWMEFGGDEDKAKTLLERIAVNPFVPTQIRDRLNQRVSQWIEERKIETIPNLSKRVATGSQRLAILKRDHNKCRYCGESLNDDYHIDHVIPYSKGGQTTDDNLVSSCPTCNRKKHDKTPEQVGMTLLLIS